MNGRSKNLFILGCPRSGTTLVQAILNRHPEIVVPPETKLFLNFHRASQKSRSLCIRRLADDWNIPFEEISSFGRLSTDTFWETIKPVYLRRNNIGECVWFGEKTPEHTSRIPAIRNVFPESRLIVVVRNGFDVAESLTRVPWIHCDLMSGAAVWSHYMKQISRLIDSAPSEVHVVRFEELVSNPTAVTKELLGFLEVDSRHVEACLTPSSLCDTRLFPEREDAWKSKSHEPVDFSKVSCGEQLTTEERNQVVFAAGQMLHRWGYVNGETSQLASPWAVGRRVSYYVSIAMMLARLPSETVLREVAAVVRSRIRPSTFGVAR